MLDNAEFEIFESVRSFVVRELRAVVKSRDVVDWCRCCSVMFSLLSARLANRAWGGTGSPELRGVLSKKWSDLLKGRVWGTGETNWEGSLGVVVGDCKP